MSEHTPVGRPAPVQDTDEPPEGFPVVIDPTKPIIVSAWGRKGSGKSTFNRRLYQSWPGDKLCIDVNGDADPGPDAEPVTLPLPSKWPTTVPPVGQRPRARNLHWRADAGSATYTDDLDRAIGMALFPQDHRTLVWAGEVGEFQSSAQGTRPHMRRLLQQNRHYHASALFDGPRPVYVDPLVLAQSDLVAVYELPNPRDRASIADNIGYPPARFDDECETTFRRGPFWFLLWVSASHRLYRCAPLPTD